MFDEKEALITCQKLAKKNKVLLKPLKAAMSKSGISFLFSAPERTDLRRLTQEINRHFKRTITFKQVTGKQTASLIPGCGRCGRPLCCRTWLKKPPQISPEEAQKILGIKNIGEENTGVCGKILCCLLFEPPKEKVEKQEAKTAKDVFLPPLPTTKQSPPPPKTLPEKPSSEKKKPKPKKRLIRRLLKM